MTRSTWTVVSWLAAACAAGAATTQPAASQATRPAASPAVMKILTDLQAAGEKYKTIRADVTMEITDRRIGDTEKRAGWIAYQKGDARISGRFRIHFDTLRQGAGPTLREKLDYAFDGHFWTVAKHTIKEMTRYQVVAKGEKAEPLRIGKGPFPLPFGQKADDVLKYYKAETRPIAKNEPKGTVYLKLTARRRRYEDLDAVRVEMWIDAKTNLPVRLVSRDKKKRDTAVTLKNLRTNAKFDPRKMFHMPRPAGWSYKVVPLNKRK